MKEHYLIQRYITMESTSQTCFQFQQTDFIILYYSGSHLTEMLWLMWSNLPCLSSLLYVVHLLIVIIQLMLSASLCPKVITFSIVYLDSFSERFFFNPQKHSTGSILRRMRKQFKRSRIREIGTPAQYKDRPLSRGPQKGGCLHRQPIGGQEILSRGFGISSGLCHWRNSQGELLWATLCSLLRIWLQASGDGFHTSLQSTGAQLDSECDRQVFLQRKPLIVITVNVQ